MKNFNQKSFSDMKVKEPTNKQHSNILANVLLRVQSTTSIFKAKNNGETPPRLKKR